MFFRHLEGNAVLIRQRGGYTTAPIFERGGIVYAKIGSNYHTLSCNGSVSGTSSMWEEFGGDLKDRIIKKGLVVTLAPKVVIPETNPRDTSTSSLALVA